MWQRGPQTLFPFCFSYLTFVWGKSCVCPENPFPTRLSTNYVCTHSSRPRTNGCRAARIPAQQGLQYLVCVFVRLSVCLSVCLSMPILTLQATRRPMSYKNWFRSTRVCFVVWYCSVCELRESNSKKKKKKMKNFGTYGRIAIFTNLHSFWVSGVF